MKLEIRQCEHEQCMKNVIVKHNIKNTCLNKVDGWYTLS